MTKRRDFLKLALASYPVLAGSKLLTACSSSTGSDFENDEFPSFATLNIFQGMPIKATFLDEISWDIPLLHINRLDTYIIDIVSTLI